uniref:Uncharacterized protein n=1 Tax=Opuntia streptacantha TaxID=393608 RepID=A0A7C8YCA2_OPUST
MISLHLTPSSTNQSLTFLRARFLYLICDVCNHLRFYTILDKYILDKSAMNFDFTHYMLFQGRKGKKNRAASSPSKEAHWRKVRKVFHIRHEQDKDSCIQEQAACFC